MALSEESANQFYPGMTYLAAISEPVLETIVYVFLAGGAVAIIGLIAYATVVFRRVSVSTDAATTAILRAVELMDCACQTLAAVEKKLESMQLPACTLSTSRLDALDHAMSRAASATKEEPRGACPKCGGAFTWPPKGSVLSESSIVLTMACGKCGGLSDVSTTGQT